MASDSYVALENGPRTGRMPASLPEFEIGVLLRALRRRKWLFLATVVLVTAGTGLFVFTVPPTYTGEALLMVEAGTPRIVQIEAIGQGIADDTRVLETQSAILKSAGLAAKVINRLNLRDDPEINPALSSGGERSWLQSAIAPLSTRFRAVIAPLSQHSSQTPGLSAASSDSVITRFLSLLSVSPKERSFIIAVQFSSRDPEKAAYIANEVVETYLHERAEAKRGDARRASLLFNDRIRDWRNKVAEAESAVERYRQEHDLTTYRGITATDQQLSELNTQLVLAQIEESRAQARLQQARELPQKPGGSDANSEVLGSALIQNLRQQEAVLIQSAAQLSSVYGNKHPKILEIQAQLRDLRQQIKTEGDKIVRSVAYDLEVAKARRAALQTQIRKLTQESAANGQAEVKLQELEREATAVRTLYTTLLSRAEEVTAQGNLQEESLLDAHMASPAVIPHTPTFPRPIPALAAGFAGSLLLGVALVMLREKLDRGVTGKAEIESLTGMRVLALVPRLAKRLTQSMRDGGAHPASWTSAPAFHEAMRRLQTAVSSERRESHAGKTLLVTSSVPEEGKSFLCASLALQLARSGHRCALVDCDFRRSRLAEILGVRNLPGLAHLFAGQMALSDVIHSSGNLDFVPSGMSGVVDRLELQRISGLLPSMFGSDVMASFLTTLAMRYDVIIIDAPPLIVSDSLVLSQLVNGTIFVVRWGRTRRDEMVAGLRQLTEHGAHIEGIVLTQVDARKYLTYGYADLEMAPQLYRRHG